MKAGISSYTFTWAIGVPGQQTEKPMTIYQLLEKANGYGVSVVQVADNLPLHKFSDSELLQIRNYAEDMDIQIEVGARGMSSENLESYINLAHFFGSPILRFVIDGPGFEPGPEEINRIIKEALPHLEENNIILAIENHDRFSSLEFKEMIEIANSPFAAICLDSVNSMGAGECLDTVIKNLAPLTANLHIKEFNVERMFHKMGFVIKGCPLGEGMLPLREMLEKVPANCTSAILEQWTPPEESLEETIEKEARWAGLSIAYLKEALLRKRKI